MNSIAVGILCGRGDTPEALKVICRVSELDLDLPVLPLFGVKPRLYEGDYFLFPRAAANARGAARNALLVECSSRFEPDALVLLDDDAWVGPNYFSYLANMELPSEPTLMGGKLHNFDGSRCWDVCSFENGHPIVVPYDDWQGSRWAGSLYLSGPQHIFNRAGWELARRVGYPDQSYGEDTNFCFAFKRAGGQLKLLPEICATLTHQHVTPNYPSAA